MSTEGNSQGNRLDILNEVFSDPVHVAYEFTGTGVDGHLQDLVSIANDSEPSISFGLTLFTTGGVVAGQLISVKSYFEQFGNLFKGGCERAYPGQDFQDVADSFKKKATSALEEDEEYQPSPQFIHLSDARIIGREGSYPSEGMLWRGKVSEVSSFILGAIQAKT